MIMCQGPGLFVFLIMIIMHVYIFLFNSQTEHYFLKILIILFKLKSYI